LNEQHPQSKMLSGCCDEVATGDNLAQPNKRVQRSRDSGLAIYPSASGRGPLTRGVRRQLVKWMRNPTRRNRRIGMTQGGRVKNGRAREKQSHRITQDIWTQLSEDNTRWRVLRENPSRHYYHPCEEKDYHQVLSRLPEEVTDCVNAIILRRVLKADERFGVEARRRYFCVIMNSFPKNRTMSWWRKPR
jgi:hypothetical protein